MTQNKLQLQNFVFVEKTVKPRISRNLAYYKQHEMIFEEKINKPKISRNLAYYRHHEMIFEKKINKPRKIETDLEGE